MIAFAVFGATFSSLQALPPSIMSLELYMILEFLVSLSTCGMLGACYAFNMEWLPAKYRIYLHCVAALSISVCPLLIGLAAWYSEETFMTFKLLLGLPGFIMILVYFVLREPPQWLLARQKYSQLIKSIKKAGKMNGRLPSTQLIEQIENESTKEHFKHDLNTKHHDQITIRQLLNENILLVRLIVLSFVWFSGTYAYYGLLLISTKVHDNKYVSFVLIGLGEIPGAFLSTITLDRLGRRITIGASLIIYGAILLIVTQCEAHQQILRIVLLFIGKAAIKSTVATISTYTTELWPTTVRNTAFNICAFFGRLGSVLSTLTVLLEVYYVQIPMILYGSIAIIGSLLLFTFMPETAQCKKAPDTLQEAVAIGETARETPDSLAESTAIGKTARENSATLEEFTATGETARQNSAAHEESTAIGIKEV